MSDIGRIVQRERSVPVEAETSRLLGRRVLLVEDEFLIAMELEHALQDVGAEVVGPIATLRCAVEEARRTTCEGAVLDVDLRGEDVYPAADALVARAIPFVFHTGHGLKRDLFRRYPAAPVCSKPMHSEQLLRTLAGLL